MKSRTETNIKRLGRQLQAAIEGKDLAQAQVCQDKLKSAVAARSPEEVKALEVKKGLR